MLHRVLKHGITAVKAPSLVSSQTWTLLIFLLKVLHLEIEREKMSWILINNIGLSILL